MFYDLVKSFLVNSFKNNKKQIGGAPMEQGYSSLSLFFTMLAVFLIKVLLVMISYNILGPRIMEKWGRDPKNFRALSFTESIFLVILFNNLFARF
jgi:hypothetical protein